MRVGIGPPMSGRVLHDRQNASIQETFDNCPAKFDYHEGITRKRAVANHLIGALHWHIEHRHAVHSNSEFSQIMGDQARIQIDCLAGALRCSCIEIAETSRWWPTLPLRRPKTHDASPLLVDQNRGAPIADGLAQRQNEPAHSFAICDVPGEKNEAPGLGVAKERPLSFGELRSGASIDCPVPRGHFTDRYSWLCGEAGSPACLQLCATRIGGGGTGEGANQQTQPCPFS